MKFSVNYVKITVREFRCTDVQMITCATVQIRRCVYTVLFFMPVNFTHRNKFDRDGYQLICTFCCICISAHSIIHTSILLHINRSFLVYPVTVIFNYANQFIKRIGGVDILFHRFFSTV